MSYYRAHPRKKEALKWCEAGRPGGKRGLFCNRFGIYPFPEMAIPEWADPAWRRHYPGLSVEELDHLVSENVDGDFQLYWRALDDLQLLDPFWQGQLRGQESGLGKKLWRQEREAYECLLK